LLLEKKKASFSVNLKREKKARMLCNYVHLDKQQYCKVTGTVDGLSVFPVNVHLK
jgi:hypothetical protein